MGLTAITDAADALRLLTAAVTMTETEPHPSIDSEAET
jgi:hypothetical protein